MAAKEKRAVRKVKSSRVDSLGTTVSLVSTEVKYLVLFDVPVRCHRRASLGLAQERSEIRKANLRKLKFTILDSIRMIVLGPDDRVPYPLFECIAFYEEAFDTRVWFLLHPFIKIS